MVRTARGLGQLNARVHDSPFTRRVALPAQRFIHTEWIGSAFLLVAAVGGMWWANSAWASSYHSFWDAKVSLDLGFFELSKGLRHWINDGLMAVFFFVVGLEIKREFLHGALSDRRRASLPILAALGGMIFPALFFSLWVPGGESARGWGIPMATDIAFALGVLGLLAKRIPSQVRIFLLALAIVDDIGAILVIAFFYTESVAPHFLFIAFLLICLILLMQRLGIRSFMAYGLVGFGVWLAVFESGVHATIAGVVLGAMTPSRPYNTPGPDYRTEIKSLVDRLSQAEEEEDHDEREATLGRIEDLTVWTESPLERLERLVHPWSSYLILPLFALANSGFLIGQEALLEAAASPVTLGVVIGLLLGNTVGISSMCWLGVKLGIAQLPDNVRMAHIFGCAILAGVGFTVSIFITGLAFEDPALVNQAKIGIVFASLVAGLAGFIFLWLVGRSRGSGSEIV